jgi:hypothetical protein
LLYRFNYVQDAIKAHVIEGKQYTQVVERDTIILLTRVVLEFTEYHSSHFIDPVSGVNTQLIENTWGVYKRKFRARGINHSCKINVLFLGFLFRIKYGKKVFKTLLSNLYIFA